MQSLAHPGTRVTGVTTMNKELTAKRLQLLMDVVAGLRKVGVVIDPAMRDACMREVDKDAIDAAFGKLAVAGVQAVTTTLVSSRNAWKGSTPRRRSSTPCLRCTR